MSEKRFICGLGFPINSDDPIRIITDKETNKDYFKFSDICEIMNEQQATIESLKKDLKIWYVELILNTPIEHSLWVKDVVEKYSFLKELDDE